MKIITPAEMLGPEVNPTMTSTADFLGMEITEPGNRKCL